jgi:hypothetical protein
MTFSPWSAEADPSFRRTGLAALVSLACLGGCAAQPPILHSEADSAPAMPPTQVYFYPSAGQSAAQQDRDRYECYLWAVKQTGFDPSQPPAPNARVEVMPVPPAGQDTATGLVSGAIIGAAVSNPRHPGDGALVGAILGTLLGAISDASRQEQAQVVQQRFDWQDAQRYNQLERRAGEYRRAMAACLEGRGYTVH